MIFRLGITESARNASVWNGDGSSQPSAARPRRRRGCARPPRRAAPSRAGRRPAAAAPPARRRPRHDDPAAELGEPLDRAGHVVVVHADDDDVVRVVRDRRGERAGAEAEAADEPEADPAGAEVALDDGDLREVALGVGDRVAVIAVGSSTSDSVTIWSGTTPITRAGRRPTGSRSPMRPRECARCA